MTLRKHSQLTFRFVLGAGALVALVLCAQCVRTYRYTDTVLVPQQGEREAEREVGVLTTAARSAGISDPRGLGPVIAHALESSSDRVLWMRVLDPESNLLAQGGNPQGTARIPATWWQKVEKHESVGRVTETTQGKAFVAMLPFRLQGLRRFPDSQAERPPVTVMSLAEGRPGPPGLAGHAPGNRRAAYVLELAIPLKGVAGAFEGLKENLIVGLIASVLLFISVVVIALRAPHYLRGKYLEGELRLARRVQSDLQPKPQAISSQVVFAAAAAAADQVGGDFHDVFEAASGKIAMVLGDVSGKGISAALLASVLHGAIRSSTAFQHELSCERINRMLCERTACERFATLFWGVFDCATGTLRYVNAGHAAPMLIRHGAQTIYLEEGGPILGMLPMARYSAGSIQIEHGDTLIVYSDGISEAANESDEEFGDRRIQQMLLETGDRTASDLCDRIMDRVAAFAKPGAPADDRTLLVVQFPVSGAATREQKCREIGEAVIA